jgi:hypothetical protein
VRCARREHAYSLRRALRAPYAEELIKDPRQTLIYRACLRAPRDLLRRRYRLTPKRAAMRWCVLLAGALSPCLQSLRRIVDRRRDGGADELDAGELPKLAAQYSERRRKQHRRIATRYEKLALVYRAMRTLAGSLLWLSPLHESLPWALRNLGGLLTDARPIRAIRLQRATAAHRTPHPAISAASASRQIRSASSCGIAQRTSSAASPSQSA